MAVEVACCGTKFALFVLMIVGLVCFAGLMAGLTLGLMSLGLVDLEVLIKSGRPQDRIHAGTLPFFLWISSFKYMNYYLYCINHFLQPKFFQ